MFINLFGVLFFSAPAIFAAYEVGNYASDVWLWHPLFAILIGTAVWTVMVAGSGIFILLLPRWLVVVVGMVYAAAVAFWLAQSAIGMDLVWSGFWALYFSMAGGFGGWEASTVLNEVRAHLSHKSSEVPAYLT